MPNDALSTSLHKAWQLPLYYMCAIHLRSGLPDDLGLHTRPCSWHALIQTLNTLSFHPHSCQRFRDADLEATKLCSPTSDVWHCQVARYSAALFDSIDQVHRYVALESRQCCASTWESWLVWSLGVCCWLAATQGTRSVKAGNLFSKARWRTGPFEHGRQPPAVDIDL